MNSTQSTSAQTVARPVLRELKCPNCGAPIAQHVPDVQTFVCGRCHGYINESLDGLTFASGSKLPQPRVPIRIGQFVTIRDVRWFVLGRVVYQGWDPSETSDRWTWNEWLLGSDDGRLFWLSLDEHGFTWFTKLRVREAFDPQRDTSIPLGNERRARVVERYPAKIIGAEGELTWRAKRGDKLTMIEGVDGENKISVQVTTDELEIHQGRTLKKEEVVATFGKEAAEKLFGIPFMTEIGAIMVLFAVAALVIALVVGGIGRTLTNQNVTVARGQAAEFPMEFAAGRPVQVMLFLQTPLQENTFADVDVVITAPDESETYVSLQEFWHETGIDEGEYWQEQRLDGSEAFVPYLSGMHEVAIEMDEGSMIDQANVRVELKADTIGNGFLFGYGAIVGIVGLLLVFMGLSKKAS
ncbi:MAG: DUF4178 domain-containing protein [Chloroflexota bacterium]|nr:DUF4178 domain-containing protein [Chloroflexota bacterium]